MCFSKEIITKDIHAQAGISVDLILKTSLRRQSMDNITCVMLTFEGFEKIFKEAKEAAASNSSVEEKILSKQASSASTEIKEKIDERGTRKIKTANGMTKKTTLSLAKNLTSSIVSQDMKETGSVPAQSIPSTTTNKGAISLSNKIMESLKQGSNLGYGKTHSPEESNNNESSSTASNVQSIKNKMKEDGVSDMGKTSVPSTTKNTKGKLNLFK